MMKSSASQSANCDQLMQRSFQPKRKAQVNHKYGRKTLGIREKLQPVHIQLKPVDHMWSEKCSDCAIKNNRGNTKEVPRKAL